MFHPRELVLVMEGIVDWWAVAGGWAIDLWLDAESRHHHDVEVVVRRCDQAIVHDALAGAWTMWCLDPPGAGWRKWSREAIQPPAFQLQARSPQGEFDLFTETTDRSTWTYRRDDRIKRPLEEVIAACDGPEDLQSLRFNDLIPTARYRHIPSARAAHQSMP